MKVKEAMQGQVVISTQGHDCGIWYVVTEICGNHLLLCDGKLHSLQHPKRKNKKHVEMLPFAVDLAQTGGSGGNMTDADVRKQLNSIKQGRNLQIGHAANMLGTNQHKEDCALVQK